MCWQIIRSSQVLKLSRSKGRSDISEYFLAPSFGLLELSALLQLEITLALKY